MNAIHFINSQHGWTIRGVTICGSGGCGTNQEVLVTSNGGQTWSRQFSASTGLSNVQFGRSIFFKDAQHGWAVGSNGGILRYSPDQGSPLTVNITKNAPCFGNNGSATANVSGGNPPYYYIWNTAHFNQTISNLSAGTYTVTVIAVGSSPRTASVTLTTPPQMTLNLSNTPSCGNAQNGTATANVIGGSSGANSKAYYWSTGANTKTISNLAPDDYYVTVTDVPSGCTVSGWTTVSSNSTLSATSVASPINNPPFSVAISPTGGSSPYMYRKRTVNGQYPNNYQTSNLFTNLAAGVYFFEVKDAVGCTFELSETVGKAGDCPYPVIFVHGLDGDDTTWESLYGNSNFRYLWGGSSGIFQSLNNAQTSSNIWGTDNLEGTADDDVVINYSINETLVSGCLYTVNMNNLPVPPNSSPSNQSAILKSGYVIKKAIEKVLQKNPTKSKVILAGHSMGGLSIREYLQRATNGNHKWWDNTSGHKVAKVFTVGTPHRGSNAFSNPLNKQIEQKKGQAIIPDPFSEAVRDLRYSYDDCGLPPPLNYTCPGRYLYGGDEGNFLYTLFWNHDVDCDGNADDNIVGINDVGTPDAWDGTTDNPNMPLPMDSVRYTYYVGNLTHTGCQPYGCFGDGVVDDQRQWLYEGEDGTTSDFMEGLSFPTPNDGINYRLSDRFTSENSVRHCCIGFTEMEDISFLVRGLDEGDFPKFAWEVKPNVKYSGMTQIRPEKIPANSNAGSNSRFTDGDWYKVYLPNNNKKIKLTVNPQPWRSVQVDMYTSMPDLYSNANSTGNLTWLASPSHIAINLVTPPLSSGTYYFRITHFGVQADDWMVPYKYKVVFQNAGALEQTDDRESEEVEAETLIGDIRPQPIAATFSLDIFSPSEGLPATFGLFNSIGQPVLERSETLAEGDNTLTFAAADLPPGIYFLTVQVGSARKTLRVVKP